MTQLKVFQIEYDWSGRRLIVNLDVDSAYAARGGRNDLEGNMTRNVWNWLGTNYISAYRDYFARPSGTGPDTFATSARLAYPIRYSFDDNRIVLDVRGGDYDKGLFDCFASQRDAFSLNLKGLLQTWLAAH